MQMEITARRFAALNTHDSMRNSVSSKGGFYKHAGEFYINLLSVGKKTHKSSFTVHSSRQQDRLKRREGSRLERLDYLEQ